MYLQKLAPIDLVLRFKFDETVKFEKLNMLYPFLKEVLSCYCKANTTDIEQFKKSIIREPIWGKRFIVIRRKKQKSVIFLRNWIRSGIVFINDLKFRDGILDCRSMLDIVLYKQDIFAEMIILKKALLPYRDVLKELIYLDIIDPVKSRPIISKMSKSYYSDFLESKVSQIQCMSAYLHRFRNTRNIYQQVVFIKQIV